jgi:phosphoribosyl-ATP pyrophosphohydrolase/phosphoribosyl-AMP cyclohydrolase
MDVSFDHRGLVPGIVRDARTGRVLMLAYLNEESLAETIRTGEVHFWSRSRNELWHKGATSGNTMSVRGIRPDCDGDTLLIDVEPAGPACHTGAETCFGDDQGAQGFARLERLWTTIRDRSERRPEGSYTVHLLDAGVDRVGRKVVEEAAETAFAAKDHAAGAARSDRVAEEAADLVYHLLVLLAERDVAPVSVLDELARREG